MFFLKGEAGHAISLLKTFQWLPIMLWIKQNPLLRFRRSNLTWPLPASLIPFLTSLPLHTSHTSTARSLLPESPRTSWSLGLRLILAIFQCSAPSCHSGHSLHKSTFYHLSQVASQLSPHGPLLILSIVLCPWYFRCTLNRFMLLSSMTITSISFTLKCGEQILWSPCL